MTVNRHRRHHHRDCHLCRHRVLSLFVKKATEVASVLRQQCEQHDGQMVPCRRHSKHPLWIVQLQRMPVGSYGRGGETMT